MPDWNDIRYLFPATQNKLYFDTAASGLLPSSTAEYMRYEMLQSAKSGTAYFPEQLEKIERVRKLAASLLHANSAEVAFVPNVATGMDYVARLFAKDHTTVAALKDDYPTVRKAWELLNYKIVNFEAEVNGHIDIEKIIAAEADILVISYVQWHTGFKIDLEQVVDICKERGQLFVLDATQAWGYEWPNVTSLGIDIFLCSNYKWTVGGHGNCVMYMQKDLLKKYDTKLGWRFEEYLGEPMPAHAKFRFELGHPRIYDILRSGTGLELLQRTGTEELNGRINWLNDYLRSSLQDAGLTLLSDYAEENRSAISIFEGDDALFQQLSNENVMVSQRGRGLRFAAHFYNNIDDIENLTDIVSHSLSKLD